MKTRNALSPAPASVDERYDAAQRRNNHLREKPHDTVQSKGWKLKVRPTGGLKPSGIKLSGQMEF